MKKNYYFLWSYNKFPFVYSIMKENENNILILNVESSPKQKNKFTKLKELDKINEVIIIENSLMEYFASVFYRIFIYPFKFHRDAFSLYIDGFVGYYPVFLANLGVPEKLYFYEEGESIYNKERLLMREEYPGWKQALNNKIKKLLFINTSSIEKIECFYVRNKERMLNVISSMSPLELSINIEQVEEIECIKRISNHDKSLLKKVFFSESDIECLLESHGLKKAIVLTQPISLYGKYTEAEAVRLFNLYIQQLKDQNYTVFLKLHPQEKKDLYTTDNVYRIRGQFPFELLSLFDVEFEKGLTYNSTAINCKLIKEKVLIANEDN